MTGLTRPLLALATLLATSCGGGGSYSPPATPPAAPKVDFSETGMAVVKVRASLDGATLLEEKASPITEAGPQRRITLVDSSGAVRARYAAPAGTSLIDFAQHASGEISVALATARTVILVRVARNGSAVSEFALLDAQAANDPFMDLGGVHDDTSMVPFFTRDAVRLAPTGSDGASLVVALRTGRNAVVAYRFDYGTPGGYTRAWRTLVEPGVSMFGLGITSGTYDTFGQLENHFHVHVDADSAGNAAVAVAGKPGLAPAFLAHSAFFGEPQVAAVVSGALVTQLSPDGARIGTTVVDSVRVSELHGLRMHFDGIAIVGRVFTEQREDGSGWDGYIADVARTSGALRFYRVIDVDRGDALFDVLSLGDWLLVTGTTGYTQNPTGASVSEQSAPLLLRLTRDGGVQERIAWPAGARQNQVRSIALLGNDWLVGSVINGPGTHSGDADPSRISADGAAREVAVSVP